MGIHFVCHHCGHALHVKNFQAGKRGKCPSCNGSFRVPNEDSSYSQVLDTAALQTIPSTDVASNRSIPQESDRAQGILNDQAYDAVSMEDETSESFPSNAGGQPTMPAVLQEAGNAVWFVRPPSGGQFGPAASRLLMNWIAENRVTPDSLLWRDGLTQWQLASELLPDLFRQTAPTGNLETADQATLPSVAGSALVRRRNQKRRQQVAMVAILSTVSLVLLGVLIYVLVSQAGS